MTKHAVVTGGAGFVGSQIVDLLLQGGYKVTALDDLSSGRNENLNPAATLFKADIRSEEAAQFISTQRPDLIVHAAAQMSVRVSMERPTFDTDVNITGMINLLNAATSYRPTVLFCSTGGAIYGEQDFFPADESHPCKPASIYGQSKRAAELYLDFYAREFKFKCFALRLGNVYGPRQNPHGEAGVVAIFCQKLLKGEIPTINGTGDQTRDFVFVKDVAAAFIKAATYLESRPAGTFEITNIGTSQETSVNTLYADLAKAAGITEKARYADGKAGEQLRSCITAARAEKLLGWKPQVTVQEGLAETFAWFKSQ